MSVYAKFAEKHYDDLLKKYEGDLDTSQIFVSTSASLTRLFLQPLLFPVLGGSVLWRYHGLHYPNHGINSTEPLRSHERPTASTIAKQ